MQAAVALAGGKSRDALESARRAIDEALDGGLPIAHEHVRFAFPIAFEAAIDIGDVVEADRLAGLLATRPAGEVPPFLAGTGPPLQGARRQCERRGRGGGGEPRRRGGDVS